nr:AlNc14C136G7088 [Albugo laibachii Nc14]|eukprot:CCA21854.1 AlNc14C136G7088 [Albugo laibachii Nc14]
MLGFYTGSSQLKIVIEFTEVHRTKHHIPFQHHKTCVTNCSLYGRNLTTFKQATSVHMNYFCAIAASTILMLIQCLDAYIMTLRSLSIYLVTLALSVHFLIPTSESQSLDL